MKNPIDTTKFQSAPCTMLTAAQAQTFGIRKPGDPGDGTTPLGPGCRYANGDGSSSFSVQIITSNKNGISVLYSNKDTLKGGGGYFEPVDVQGYPGVFNSSADQRKQGTCGLAVGVSDSLTYFVTTTLDQADPKYSDSCSVAKQIADQVMTNLRGGS